MVQISRRRFLSNGALLTGAVAGFGPYLLGQGAADPIAAMRAAGASAKIDTRLLRRDVHVVQGSGGNIAVLAGSKSKLVVDSGFATSRPQISDAIAGFGTGPVAGLINTHWHFDHTDGNEWMHAAGATITAHENTLKRLSTTQKIAAFGATFPPSPAGALPTVIITDARTLDTDGAKIELKHYAPAHTDSDLSVFFTEANVFHTGDTWFNKSYPFIDTSSGGSIDGMIAATKKNLEGVTAETIIIPGHGPVGTKAELEEFLTMLSGSRDAVATLKRQGKKIDEVVAANPTAPFDKIFSADGKPSAMFIGIVYSGV